MLSVFFTSLAPKMQKERCSCQIGSVGHLSQILKNYHTMCEALTSGAAPKCQLDVPQMYHFAKSIDPTSMRRVVNKECGL